jgi:hypothetical protein
MGEKIIKIQYVAKQPARMNGYIMKSSMLKKREFSSARGLKIAIVQTVSRPFIAL